MNDQWTNKLSDYIDDEMVAGERQALEAHLETCSDCRTTLEELRAVVARVRMNDEREPKMDLWPGIARKIGVTVAPVVRDIEERRQANDRRRRLVFSIPQLAAAAIVLAVGGAGGAYMALRYRSPEQQVATTNRGQGTAGIRLIGLLDSTGAYDASVAELQQVLVSGRSRLDTATVRILEQNLAIIDKALAEARTALAADPSSAYLSQHLAQTMRTKLELLRRAQAIAVQS